MRLATIALTITLCASAVSAADLDSASFMLRGGHTNSGSSAFLEPTVPTPTGITNAGATVGQGIAHADAAGAYVSAAGGYWAIENALAASGGVTPVPEPGFAVGLTTGLLLLAALARRRQRISLAVA